MTFVDVPVGSDIDTQWVEFAATFDVHTESGGFEMAQAIWRSSRTAFENQLPTRQLNALRTALFMEYRADRHSVRVDEASPFVSYLVEEIRDLSGGTVLRRGPVDA